MPAILSPMRLSAVLVNGPAQGTIVLFADGSFEYTPVVTYVGEITFQYVVSDGISKFNGTNRYGKYIDASRASRRR